MTARDHLSEHRRTIDRVDSIASSVHHMSHRLHPARLQLLGLVSALRALQQEKSRSGLAVTFTHGDIPAGLAPALTLCLFRVVQEALHNAIKYSQATQVLVDLKRDDAELILTIVDNGVGFDLDRAWGKGLGLISIRERVEASRGTVAIRSTEGSGTQFDVRVPLDVDLSVASWSGQSVSMRHEPEPERPSPLLREVRALELPEWN